MLDRATNYGGGMKSHKRVASKDHECVVCGEPIPAGTEYLHETALPGTDAWDFIVDNKPTSWRRHLEWATCDDRYARVTTEAV